MQQRRNLATVFAAIFAGMLLVGCSSDGSSAGPEPIEGASFDLDWDDGEIIVVELDDERSFDQAMLVAPDGSAIHAFRIERDRETSTQAVQPSLGTGVSGGSGGFGVGVGMSFPIGNYDDDIRVDYRTEAQIRVPDMVAYRAGWQDWKLRIHMPAEDIFSERTVELPAPEPPA